MTIPAPGLSLTDMDSPLSNAVLNTIRKFGMIRPGQRVCVAISGGPDSTTLLNILVALAKKLHCQIVACHYDHALRDESADDAAFARLIADKLGVPFRMERDPAPPTRSIQEQAREHRYGFFKQLIESGFANIVATGHTLDDTVETSIMWMIRGAGPTAFGGVPPVRGEYIRPLIQTRKADILQWLKRNGIENIHDKSNDSDKYLRNRLRHHLIPEMERQAPGAARAIWRLSQLVKEQEALLESMAREQLGKLETSRTKDRITIEAGGLRDQAPAIRKLIYRMELGSVGLNPSQLTTKHIDAIDRLLTAGTLGRNVDLPGRRKARLDHGGLCLGLAPRAEPFEKILFACPLGIQTPAGLLRVLPGHSAIKNTRATVDAGKIPPGALFRNREPGDFLELPNMAGRKKLKTFLIDRKVPSCIRSLLPLLADGKQILWIPGLFTAPSILPADDPETPVELVWEWSESFNGSL